MTRSVTTPLCRANAAPALARPAFVTLNTVPDSVTRPRRRAVEDLPENGPRLYTGHNLAGIVGPDPLDQTQLFLSTLERRAPGVMVLVADPCTVKRGIAVDPRLMRIHSSFHLAAMIRPPTLAAIVLVLLTALAIGQLGLLVLEPMPSVPAIEQVPGVDTAVTAFYDGINGWLAGKDRALETVLTPDFVDHARSGGADRDVAGLLADLSAIHDTSPTFRFEVRSFDIIGSIVSVDVLMVPGPAPDVEGWTIELPPPLAVREILRIERGKVAERWAADDRWPSGLQSVAFEQALRLEVFRQPAIQRFTLDPQREVDLIASGTVVVWLQSGELRIDLAGRDDQGTMHSPTEPMAPGDMRLLELDGELPVRAGTTPAVFWTVGLDTILVPRAAGDDLVHAGSIGLRQDIQVGLAVRIPDSAPHLHITLISVPTGTRLSFDTADMTGIAVVDGELTARSEHGLVTLCFDNSRSRMFDGIEHAAAAQGFAAGRGEAAIYRATGPGPTLLLLLSIDPGTTTPLPPVRTGPG